MSKHPNLSYHNSFHVSSHFPQLQSAVNSYTSRYRTAFSVPDPTSTLVEVPESERTDAQRHAIQHINEYYDIVTRSYEAGWGKQFHYGPFAPGDSISHALTFGIYRLAHLMGLRRDMKVLDLGCGVGGPTREFAKFVGCEVVGVNINAFQVNRAIELTAQQGLGHLCTFVVGDFMRLVDDEEVGEREEGEGERGEECGGGDGKDGEGLFGKGGCFDAVVAVEALCHAPNWEAVYDQISRVLKPGGVFGFTEEVFVDEDAGVSMPGIAGERGATKKESERVRFDEGDARHVAIRNRLEVGTGVSRMGTVKEARAALRKVGFEIDIDEDFARHFDRLYDEPAIVKDERGDVVSWSTVRVPTRNGQFRYAPAPKKPYPNIEIDVELGLGSKKGRSTIPPVYRPWYYPLMGTKLAVALGATAEDRRTASQMSHSNRRFWFRLSRLLVWLKIWPAEVVAINQTMTLCVDNYVEAGRLGIFTPCWMFVCRKPVNAISEKFAG